MKARIGDRARNRSEPCIREPYRNSDGGKRPARRLGASLAALAKTAKTSNPNIPAWSPYDTKLRAVMVFDADRRQVNDPDGELWDMWDTLYRAR